MRRLFSPRWLLVHVLLFSLTGSMVFFGFWQLDRLEQRRDRNATIERNISQQVVAASQVEGNPDDEWRRVSVTGTYVPTSEISIINRSQDNVAGDNLAVAIRSNDNQLFLVNRGFVPLTVSTRSLPTGNVTVVGYVRFSQTRGTLGAVDSSAIGTKEFQRFDLPLIGEATRTNINTRYFIQLAQETPAPNTTFPAPVPLPIIDEGPHFSYAIQWFFFSVVAVTGWVVVIVRALRRDPSEGSPTQTSA